MRRRLALVGCAAALLLSAACRGERDVASGTLLFGTGADAETLIPLFVRGAQAAIVTDLLCDHLAEVGPAQGTVGDAGFLPELAASWSWNRDSSAVTFHLNPKARWHDGTPVHGSDVAYTFALLRDPATASPVGPDLAMVDSVRASTTDSLAVTVYFGTRQPDRFYWVAKSLVPIPKAYYRGMTGRDWDATPLARAPVCSGPYKFASWQPQVSLVLDAVPDHYRQPPHIAHVHFVYRGDAQSGANSALTGETDLWEGITQANLARASESTVARVLALPNYDYTFIAFNIANPATGAPTALLGDSALRRALTLATDTRTIRRSIWGDTLATALVGPVVRQQFTYDSSIVPLPYDPAWADALLDSLGWTRGADGVRARGSQRLALTAIVPAPAKARVDAATILQAQWKARGIALMFEPLEFQTFLERQRRRAFDLTIAGWRTQPTPYAILSTWGVAGIATGTNLPGWTAPAVAAHFDSARATVDVAEVRRHFGAAYRSMVTNPPALWLYEPAAFAIVHRRLEIPPIRQAAWWRTIPTWRIRADANASYTDHKRLP